ncbi:MAG: DsbE family thiol:disulfide interchange protein [Parvibaculaceae bacterium]|nr:DsbE family thiol:disulfide interchange protein [Parvibaculaceae bacterium]
MKRLPVMALLPVAIFAGIAILFYAAIFQGDPSVVPSAMIGHPVPQFSLPPVEGLDRPGLASADFGHGTPVIVNVWASWCVPCRAEAPLLDLLRTRTAVPIFGINYKDDPDAARTFLAQLGNPFTRVGADSKGQSSIDWGVYGVPETYVVDGKGRIIYKHVGPIDADLIESEILPTISKAAMAP